MAGEEDDEVLVLLREVLAALLLRQVEVAVGHTSQQDRDAEEAAHRWMRRRKTDRARILGEVVQPQRLRVTDQHAEDAAAARQGADLGACVGVDAVRDELLEFRPARVDHPERRVAGARQLGRRLHEPVQQRIQRQLRTDDKAGGEQCAQPSLGHGERVHGRSLRRDHPYGKAAGAVRGGADARDAKRDDTGGNKEARDESARVSRAGTTSLGGVPDPTIQAPTDVVVKIDSSTICGTDLHILKGDVPEVAPGTILGHEAVGTVVEIGSAVTTLEPGDRVLVSCITSCGRCRFCKEGRYGLCTGGGGWIFGHLIDGLQAEYARVPFADTSVYKVPEELSDEQVLFLADILPTAYEVGVLNGGVSPATRSRSSAQARLGSRRS